MNNYVMVVKLDGSKLKPVAASVSPCPVLHTALICSEGYLAGPIRAKFERPECYLGRQSLHDADTFAILFHTHYPSNQS